MSVITIFIKKNVGYKNVDTKYNFCILREVCQVLEFSLIIET